MLCQLVGNLGGVSWCTADAHEPVGASDALRVELGDNFEDTGIHESSITAGDGLF